MNLYNTLTRKVEEFKPISGKKVGMYTCGPTVYSYITIGNWRTYFLGDLLVRVLKYMGYEVDYIMNITDVGHLTGDNLGDADVGEDRLEKAAKKEGKTAWEISKFYTKDFLKGFDALNLIKPRKFTVATEYIKDQIKLVEKIEKKGFSYKISDGIYFDTGAYERAGNKYGELSNLEEIKDGARIKKNPEKKDPRDFALWKFSPTTRSTSSGVPKRHMEWNSPWGVGFPGWHVECSAMGLKELGEQFDLHVGGEDLRSTHHPNEIAQSESATNKKPFVSHWVHGAFLTVDGGRMGKSLGNAYTLGDISKKGFSALDLRYFYLTGHYKKPLNFTWKALEAAQVAYKNMIESFASAGKEKERQGLSEEKLVKVDKFREKFSRAVGNDLAMPEAVAVTWEVLKSNIPGRDKYDLVLEFDRVLGLNLASSNQGLASSFKIPEEVKRLVEEREMLRREKKWDEADRVREKIEKQGYLLEDVGGETKIKKK